MHPVVSGLAITAVKGTRLREVAEVELAEHGARGNRRFYVIDERDRMLNGKQLGELHSIVTDYSEPDDVLTLTLPDGRRISAPVDRGELITTAFFSRTREARLVPGPWSAAISAHVGRDVRLVESLNGAVDRGTRGGASLISRASLARLAEVAIEPEVDARRFRMLIELDGVPPHHEDGWVGRKLQVGDALIAVQGHVGRCLVTSRHPETGIVDLPTLDLLKTYRRELESTEPLAFGVYGEVRRAATVRLGDPITLFDS
jgi:uncharacterized protein